MLPGSGYQPAGAVDVVMALLEPEGAVVGAARLWGELRGVGGGRHREQGQTGGGDPPGGVHPDGGRSAAATEGGARGDEVAAGARWHPRHGSVDVVPPVLACGRCEEVGREGG